MEVIKSIDNLVGNSNELWKIVRTEENVKVSTLKKSITLTHNGDSSPRLFRVPRRRVVGG